MKGNTSMNTGTIIPTRLLTINYWLFRHPNRQFWPDFKAFQSVSKVNYGRLRQFRFTQPQTSMKTTDMLLKRIALPHLGGYDLADF
jgi:hypothetical protein